MADLKQLARRIFLETLAAIDIPAAMQRKLWRDGWVLHCGDELVVDLRAFNRVCVIAIGKASHGMVEGLVPVIPPESPLRWGGLRPRAPRESFERPTIFCRGTSDTQSRELAGGGSDSRIA